MAAYHLAILKKHYLEAILDGCKTIESRFTKVKCPPFGSVSAGDKIFFKLSSGPVCATATVRAVKTFEHLSADRLRMIKQKYNAQILGSDKYWLSRKESKVGVLIWLKGVQTIEPVRINKKDWRAWVILTGRENFGLPYLVVPEKDYEFI